MKAEIAHFYNFDEVVQLMVENGDDEVRKHLDRAPRNANYGSQIAISETLIPLACGSNKVFSDLLKKLHSIQYWLMSSQIWQQLRSFQSASDGLTVLVHQWNISWDLSTILLVMKLQYLLH